MKPIIEGFATVATIIGLFLLSENNAAGFLVGLLGNLGWIVYAWKPRQLGIILVNVILLAINIHGIAG